MSSSEDPSAGLSVKRTARLKQRGATPYVWVQLYYEGQDEPKGQPIKIKPAPEDVADLAEAVKKELELDAPVNMIFVYHGRKSFDKAIDPGDSVPPGTSSKNPLIVVAPAPPQQPQADAPTQPPVKDGATLIDSNGRKGDKSLGPAEDSKTKELRKLLTQWEYSEVFVMKRKREERTDVISQPLKKLALEKDVAGAGTTDNDSSVAGQQVTVFPPKEDYKWYLGDDADAFYLRPCVRDLASFILTSAFKRQREKGPTLYLISGALGIGKSWSINVFMSELLRAGKKVFFHSGEYARAWEIKDAKTLSTAANTIDITDKDNNWLYLYDSPGAKGNLKEGNQAELWSGHGKVTLIFSSPKRLNYNYAYAKSNGMTIIFNLPTWKLEEMVKVKGEDHREAVRASYDIWGGNMRALDRFLSQFKADPAKAKRLAEEEIDSQIKLIDKDLAQKMTKKLEKQELEVKLSGQAVQDSPGHILTPEPMVTDPKDENCFQEFQWRFCSPLAEKKFFRQAEELDHDVLKKLLISVFEVPSPRGILFEKVSHLLITNGIVRTFKWYPYKDNENLKNISFQPCEKIVNFATGNMEDEFRNAFQDLSNKTGAIALEPSNTSFDAVDMFVLVREPKLGCACEFSLYLLQDTIAKKHSFHPVKVLWYCSLFCDLHKKIFPTATATEGDLLNCCKYVPIVPRKEPFSFASATSTSEWNELVRVKELLGFEWPLDFGEQMNAKQSNWESVVKNHQLTIPETTKGDRRVLNKSVVGNALLLKESDATTKVEEACQVICDVVKTWQNEN